jgi:hypothetical protein
MPEKEGCLPSYFHFFLAVWDILSIKLGTLTESAWIQRSTVG